MKTYAKNIKLYDFDVSTPVYWAEKSVMSSWISSTEIRGYLLGFSDGDDRGKKKLYRLYEKYICMLVNYYCKYERIQFLF